MLSKVARWFSVRRLGSLSDFLLPMKVKVSRREEFKRKNLTNPLAF